MLYLVIEKENATMWRVNNKSCHHDLALCHHRFDRTCMIQSSLLHEEYREKTSYETEDGVELRKSGVDEGVCHHVVALGLSLIHI